MQSAPTWRRAAPPAPPLTLPARGLVPAPSSVPPLSWLRQSGAVGTRTCCREAPLVKRDPCGGVCGGRGRPGTSRPGGLRWPPLWSCRAGGRSPHAGFPGCGFHVVRKLHPVISDLLGSFKSKRNYMLETCFSLVSSLENFVSLNFPAAF